ncbi:MAG TPA: D-alanine--D-alanine ligase [Stellaceae bacterium]|nr:D-alanine--D-alanine ligase [Stellaceae bacterium]
MKRVAVLMGGWSAEREISLVSGRECARALANSGYQVTSIDVTRDLAALLAALRPAPDAAFIALHGRGGEDGTIQAVLEMLRIPYTHSGVAASAIAMDKPLAKRLFAAAGLPLAESVVATPAALAAGDVMPRPYVIKPVNEGSSVGVRIVHCGDNGVAAALARWTHGDRVMVERYVPGREITVAVMGDRALDVLEIRPAHGALYDYDAKYAPGGSVHVCPAPIHPQAYREAQEIALGAHRALGCRGVSRADLRYDDTAGEPGRVVLLELNTQPGMTPTSLVPEIAAQAGHSFGELLSWMVEDASCSR